METVTKIGQIKNVARELGLEYKLTHKVIDSYYGYIKYMINDNSETETGFLGFLVFTKNDEVIQSNSRNTYAYQVSIIAEEIKESYETVKGILDCLRNMLLNDIKSGMLGYNLFSLATIWTESGRFRSKHSTALSSNVRIRATNWIRSEVSRDYGKTLV